MLHRTLLKSTLESDPWCPGKIFKSLLLLGMANMIISCFSALT